VAIINHNIHPQISDLNEYSDIIFICPVCKFSKGLKFPKSIISQAKQLTTISIPKGLVCDHHFQAFVDKQFKVRGYQKVDFEFAYELIKRQKSKTKKPREDDIEFYKNLIVEGNYLEYRPKEYNKKNQKNNVTPTNTEEEKQLIESVFSFSKKVDKIVKKNNRDMTLEEIYNEFWEFISDKNQTFREFIEKDSRRENYI